jgi:uncharacterized protein
VLMLRGPQTPGELKQRTERMQAFSDLAAVQETLEMLIGRDLVVQLTRRPGQKEERYAHRLSEDLDDAPPDVAVRAATSPPPVAAAATSPPRAVAAAAPSPPPSPPPDGADARLDRLERDVAELRAELRALREELGA